MVYSVGLKLVVVGLDSVVGDAKVAVADFWISKLAVAIAAPPTVWGQTTCSNVSLHELAALLIGTKQCAVTAVRHVSKNADGHAGAVESTLVCLGTPSTPLSKGWY